MPNSLEDNLEMAIRGQHSREHSRGYRDGYQRGYSAGKDKRIKELQSGIKEFSVMIRAE